MKSFILESRDPFKKVSFFISHEVKKTKYDTLYFGHVLIHKYRTWGFFYQSQLDFISRDISLYKTFTSRPDYNTSSGNHFGKKKAKDENFLFTSLIFYIYFNYSFENILKRHKCYEKGRLSYSAEYRLDQSHNEIISYKKLNKYFRDLLDDRYSVRTPKGHNINSFKTFKISSFEKFQGILSNMSGLENIDDMILFKETNSRLNKKIRMYFNKNKILNRKGEKQLNIKLILNMFFLQRIFNNIELKSFELYKKLLIKVYQDYACFKDPSMLFSYSNYDFEDFLYVFNHLKGRNPVKTFLKWRIYGRLLKDYRKSISNIKKSGVDFSKYREPLNDYRFLSSRYSAENNKDLKLPSSYFSHRKDKLIEFNDLYNIGNISIKLIKVQYIIYKIQLKFVKIHSY